jgi:hypothetical protein
MEAAGSSEKINIYRSYDLTSQSAVIFAKELIICTEASADFIIITHY